MHALYFCTDDGNDAGLPSLVPSPNSVVKEMHFDPAAGDGQAVSETIHLALEGQPAEIQAFLSGIERGLTQARREAAIPGGECLNLVCQIDASLSPWRSKLLDGRLALGPGSADQRATGAQRCTLSLRRVDWWEAAAAPALPRLENALGYTSGGPLAVSNHADAGHTPLVDVPALDGLAQNVQGDLPAPANLVIGLADANYAYPLTFYVGETWRENATQLSQAYAGESGAARGGAAGAVIADDACAGGQYLKLDWTGAQEQEIWGIDIPAAEAKILAGYPALPLLRLQAGISSGEGLWYRWRVYVLKDNVEHLCGESAGQMAETGSQLISGPALALPPWLVDQTYLYAVPALRLALTVQAAGSGAHTLGIDSLMLLGLDGWRIYRPLTDQASSGFNDNPARGTLYRYLEHAQSHAAEGPGFMLQPGQAQRFSILALSHTPGGKTVPIDLELRAWIYYRPRKRNL